MSLLWIGITIGMYLGGNLFFFQKSFYPKKILVRFATTALGAFIPVLLLVILGFGLGIHHPLCYISPGPRFFGISLESIGILCARLDF